MKFKVGQKVHIKKWDDAPQGVLATWGVPSFIGEVGVVLEKSNIESVDGYNICFPEKQGSLEKPPSAFYLLQEMEPVIRVGEQLMFDFMEK